MTLVVGFAVVPSVTASATDIAPVINSAVLAPAHLPPSGGAVTLTATVTVQKGTTLSVTLSSTGPSGPEIYTDKYGRVKVQFHWDREGNAAQTPVTYTATLHASTKYSDGTTQVRTTVLHGGVGAYHWTPTASTVTFPMKPTAISCGNSQACAVAGTGGYVGVVTHGRPHFERIDGTNTLTAVSCVGTVPMTCLAVDNKGNAVALGLTDWLTPKALFANSANPHPTMTSVSCVQTHSSTLVAWCMASDDQGNVYFVQMANNHTPLIAHTATDSAVTGGVFDSCPTPTLCVEVDSSGKGISFSGQGSGNTLSFAVFSDGGKAEGAVTGLSCDPTGVCVVSESRGTSTTFRPGTTTTNVNAVVSPNSIPLSAVSCPTSTYCMAGNSSGQLFQGVTERTAAGHAWNNVPRYTVKGSSLVSCVGMLTTSSPLVCTAIAASAGSQSWHSGVVGATQSK